MNKHLPGCLFLAIERADSEEHFDAIASPPSVNPSPPSIVVPGLAASSV